MGNTVISHFSSACYWGHVGSASAKRLVPSDVNPLLDCSSPLLPPWFEESKFPGLRERPVHLLVPNRSLTRISDNVHTHLVQEQLPEGSFYQIAEGLFVCSPEYTLAQLARFLTLAQLAEAASEMLSDYYNHPHTERLEERKWRIATKESMSSFGEYASCRGARKMREAIKLVLEHARSPMEIKAALLISLPRHLGGYAFPRPTLNFEVPIGDLYNLVEQESFTVDIAYPGLCVGVEYFGEETHPSAAADRRRINGLRALGWEILTLDKWQLYNSEAFYKFMLQLGKVTNDCLMRSQSDAAPRSVARLEDRPVPYLGEFVRVPPASERLQSGQRELRAELGLF